MKQILTWLETLPLKALTLFCLLSLSTMQGYSQQQRIRLQGKASYTLKEVFNQIEKQTKLLIEYNGKDIDDKQPVPKLPSEGTVDEVLKKALSKMNCEVVYRNSNIIVRKVSTQENDSKQIKIKGVVNDNTGLSVIGATVMVKGTTNGAVTDIDGHFELDIELGQVLSVSYVGYVTQEVVVKRNMPLTITLVEDSQMLNEVVVVGYGTQKKANLTGSVASVNMAETLGDRPIASTSQALQGAAPGLQIITDTGRPGQSSDINIRGFTSINGGSPLILVDNAQVNNIDDINPKDIESISVLKDASASAIYGARGAFGVILITTKKGDKESAPRFSYSTNIAFTQAIDLPQRLNTYQTAKALQAWEVPSNGLVTDVNRWVELLEEYQLYPESFPANGIYTDAETGNEYPLCDTYDYWADAFNTGFEQIHNLSLTGGSKKMSYRISLGYTDQDGILVTNKDSYKKYNLNSSFTSELASNLTTTINLFYRDDVRKTPYGMWKVFSEGILGAPYARKGIYEDQSTGEEIPYWHPVTWLENEPAQTNKVNDLRVSGNVQWKPIKGMTIGAEYTIDKRQTNTSSVQTMNKYINGSSIQQIQNAVSYFTRSNALKTYHSFSATARYEKSIKDHNLNTIVGVNYEDTDYEYMSARRDDLINPDYPSFGTANGDMTNSDSYYEWAVAGLFGRINYNYKEKYLLEFSARYDGSSRFARGDRFVFVPSGSMGWHISREKFMESLAPTLNSLKVFASYGEIGNQNTSGYYPYIPVMDTYNSEWINNETNLLYLTAGTPNIISAGFTWERVRTLNVGVDFGFFNNRLTGTFEWYRRQTLGMLDAANELPKTLGTNAPKQNVSDLEVKGWEINLKWKDKIGNVNYSIGANLFDSRAYITKVMIQSGNINNYYVGKEIGELWGYTCVGFYGIDDFEEGIVGKYSDSFTLKEGIAPFKNKKHIPGDIRFADLDGNGTVDWGTNTLDDHGDLRVIGNNRPRYQYGINGSLSYKNVDFSFFLQGVGKRDRFINDYYTWPYYSTFTYAVFKNQTDVWTADNQNAWFPRVMSPNYSLARENNTRYMFNGAYLSVKNITVGYSLPKSLLSKVNIKKARIYLSGENLFLFDHMPDGLQSESYIESSGAAYPMLRKFSFGIDVNF